MEANLTFWFIKIAPITTKASVACFILSTEDFFTKEDEVSYYIESSFDLILLFLIELIALKSHFLIAFASLAFMFTTNLCHMITST